MFERTGGTGSSSSDSVQEPKKSRFRQCDYCELWSSYGGIINSISIIIISIIISIIIITAIIIIILIIIITITITVTINEDQPEEQQESLQ